jgi:hypothetical protein
LELPFPSGRIPRTMRTKLILCVVLALAAAAIYWPVAGHKFINYDDNTDITDNRHVTDGLTLGGIGWAFGSIDFSNWIPLTRISWMIDWSLFGPWAGGHHLVDAALHTASGLLLFLVLASMTAPAAGAARASGARSSDARSPDARTPGATGGSSARASETRG